MPWYDWLMVPVWALSGSIIYTAALVTFTSLAFKFVGPYSYTLMIPHTLLQASRYPLSIYPVWVRLILLFLIPYGAFNFLPGSWVMGKMSSPLLALSAPVVAILCAIIAQMAWERGLRQYQSTGS
jgi:ABC-2 type transport system permease protein